MPFHLKFSRSYSGSLFHILMEKHYSHHDRPAQPVLFVGGYYRIGYVVLLLVPAVWQAREALRLNSRCSQQPKSRSASLLFEVIVLTFESPTNPMARQSITSHEDRVVGPELLDGRRGARQPLLRRSFLVGDPHHLFQTEHRSRSG